MVLNRIRPRTGIRQAAMEHFGAEWSTLEMHSSLERPEFLARQLGIDVLG
jgi:hypothetical protein